MSKTQKGWIIGGVTVVIIIAVGLLIVSIRAQASGNSSGTSAYQTTTVQLGTLTSTVEGTGTVASLLSANLNWSTGGQVGKVSALIGDQVKAGDILATLLQDSTQSTLESNLVTAQQNLAQLTSPEAIANAKIAVTTAETDVINAQAVVNNQQYWKNDALIQNYYASDVIAKANLDAAQTRYDNAHVGQYINNTGDAALFQALYNAQQAYNTAHYYYSLYSQAPTQRQTDGAQANLDLANATLASAKTYLAVLTGGNVPEGATGADLLKLNQARLAVQVAQENLDALKVTAPFNGTITQANAIPNAVVSTGTQAYRIDDLSNLVIDVQVVEIDIDHVKVGQTATITFDAIPNKTYTGKVLKTDLAGTVSQNSTTFIVTVQLTDADASVRPGIAANVTIVTNQVENALIVPSTSIFSDNKNQTYVNLVQNDGSLTQVPVTVGVVADSTSQVTSPTLKPGDTIVLSFGSASSSSTGGPGGFGAGAAGNAPGTTVNGNPQVVTP
jgi:HlyD family secretion protein